MSTTPAGYRCPREVIAVAVGWYLRYGLSQPHPIHDSRVREFVEARCDVSLKDPVIVPGAEGVNLRDRVLCSTSGAEAVTDRLEMIRAWVRSLAAPATVVYETGPTSFGLARFLLAEGVECAVVAPSKLQRPAGDRVKTDVKDALHLARLLHLGEITAVTVPSVEQEAARDLVRSCIAWGICAGSRP